MTWLDDVEARAKAATPEGWIAGTPPRVYASEWFIAKLRDGSKVVLRALPEGYSPDFKTADDTYYKKEQVVFWMQFPDSEFIGFFPNNEDVPILVERLRRAIAELRALENFFSWNGYPICDGKLADSLESPPSEPRG